MTITQGHALDVLRYADLTDTSRPLVRRSLPYALIRPG